MELASLIKGQQELFEQLRKADRNLKKANQEMRSKYSYLTTRLEALSKLEEAFNQNHLEIVAKATPEQVLVLPYFKEDMQDNFQEYFLQYKTVLREYIALCNPTTMTIKTGTSTSETAGATPKVNSCEVKLPRIELPKFSGKYSEWQSFFDMFVSLIHENSSLSPVQKLHYLKSNLTGEPEMLLRNFPTTSANYTEAWEQLTKRYNNRKYNCNAILKTLFGQKTIYSESASAIRLLLDTTTSCLKAQLCQNLNIKTELWNAIIVHLVVSKLDYESHRQWERELSSSDELPEWSQLENFLEMRFRSLEMLDAKCTNTTKLLERKNLKPEINTRVYHAVEEKTSAKCAMCDGPHFIYHCADFTNLPVLERQKIAQTKRLCYNCMAPTHPVFKCHQRTSCRRCGRKHHTTLHFEKDDRQAFVRSRQNDKQTEPATSNESKSTNVIANFSRGDVKTNNVLLTTAIVKTMSHNGSCVLRALIDQGSQASFISEETVQLLGLKRTSVSGRVSSLGDGHLRIKHAVSFDVVSRYDSGKTITVNAYVLRSLTTLLPSREVHIPNWVELKHLPLADPRFASPGRIDVLLGADVYGEILLNGIEKCSTGNLIAQNTIFGWIISGRVAHDTKDRNIKSLHVQAMEDEFMRKPWDIKNEPNSIYKKKPLREKRNCVKSYTRELQLDEKMGDLLRDYHLKILVRCADTIRDVKSQRVNNIV